MPEIKSIDAVTVIIIIIFIILFIIIIVISIIIWEKSGKDIPGKENASTTFKN